MAKKFDEKALENYANSVEGGQRGVEAPTYDLPIDNTPKTMSDSGEAQLRAQAAAPRMTMEEAHEARRKEVLTEINSNGLGYLRVPIADLPTKGMFYPEGTEIFIRAAIGTEIRHWSQTNETELSDIDDSLNYMLERCVSVRMPNRLADFKDLCEIDRFYIILGVRDFTFPDGNNELMVRITENKQIPLKKDNIDFVKFEDKMMRFYNPTERCFTIQNFTAKNGQEIHLKRPLNIYIPKIGVNKWLKEYAQRKGQAQEMFDRDFITMAPMLISDYRGLNDDKYGAFVAACDYFSIYEYTLIEQFKRAISNSISPRFKYVDEEGVEQNAPLNFQGGIKALFLYNGLDDLI